jgi:hypothetical protein
MASATRGPAIRRPAACPTSRAASLARRSSSLRVLPDASPCCPVVEAEAVSPRGLLYESPLSHRHRAFSVGGGASRPDREAARLAERDRPGLFLRPGLRGDRPGRKQAAGWHVRTDDRAEVSEMLVRSRRGGGGSLVRQNPLWRSRADKDRASRARTRLVWRDVEKADQGAARAITGVHNRVSLSSYLCDDSRSDAPRPRRSQDRLSDVPDRHAAGIDDARRSEPKL